MAVGGHGAEPGREASPRRRLSAPLAGLKRGDGTADGRAGVESVWQARRVVCVGVPGASVWLIPDIIYI